MIKPGRELDALVAEKVMGWHLTKDRSGLFVGYVQNDVHQRSVDDFKPSVYIADAWLVVEKLSVSYLFCLENSGSFWVADFGRSVDGRAKCAADTAPHAICLAALKLVGYIQ